MLVGVITYLASYTTSLLHSRRARANIAIHVFTALVITAIFVLYHDELLRLFQDLIGRGFRPGDRFNGYAAGWQQFLDNPILGATFYPVDETIYSWSTSAEFVAFFPPRWHNTFLQMLASCGVVGLAAYLYHRVQTFCLFLRHFSGKKMFAFVSMLTLLVTSLVDCHFFNIGPVLFYSAMLAFVEKRLDQ